jgi:predicted RNase H-like HicB family nuclease
MKIRLTEEIWKEGNMYVSYCPELDIASCGEDVQQAKKNLMEAVTINIEETKKMGTFEQFLENCGLEKISADILSARKELVGFTPIEVAIQ